MRIRVHVLCVENIFFNLHLKLTEAFSALIFFCNVASYHLGAQSSNEPRFKLQIQMQKGQIELTLKALTSPSPFKTNILETEQL